MRRVWWVLAVVAVVGCDNFRDLFSAHAEVAAEAAGRELSAERLAHIMGDTKQIRVTRDAADFVANIWVDYTLFAQALADGVNLSDSAAVRETMWPQIAMIRADRWFDTLLSRKLDLSPQATDSLYNSGEIRPVQHILYTVPSTADAAERQRIHGKAQASLARIRAGADFGAIARAESQDFQSARDSGYLPPQLWKRGSTVTAFDSAAWSLSPGAVSGLVETPYGYHIIKRPTADQVRDRLTDYLESSVAQQLDSVYRDSLMEARNVKVTGSAVALMRRALEDPEGQRHSGKAITTYKGGEFNVEDYLRWVFALSPQVVGQLQQAQDSQLVQIAKVFTQNELILEQANGAGVDLTPLEWQELQQQHRAEIDSLRQSLGLGSQVTDSSIDQAEREKLAALRIETYFDDLVSGKARVRRIPATLSAWLRQHQSFRVNEAGLTRAVELAQAAQKADSTADSSGAAPGQAPQGGDSTVTPPASPAGARPATPSGGQ